MKPSRFYLRGSDERGYALLILLLAMALMAIAAGAIVSSISFEIRRDREEEMVHRGTQYSRAIRAYFKKFGRYPTKLEDLDNTQNMRFLRKHYKDPLNCKPTCQDFKLLHYGDVQMAMGGGIGGGTIPGASAIGGAVGGLNSPSGLGQSSPSGFQPAPGFSGTPFASNTNSPFGQNGQAQTQTPEAGGTDPTQAGAPSSSQPGTQGTPQAGDTNANASGGANAMGFSGGNLPIVGVASAKKDATIREYNKKKKYNEWYFVYDPSMDRGGLITTPYQPQLQQGFGQTPNVNGQNGNGLGSGFGSGNGLPPSGMQNNPNLPPGGGFGTPAQPSNPPQQQQ